MIYDDGAVLITVFGQLIDFTKKMYKGLINTNQRRSFGVQCVNEPNNPTSKLAFCANNLFLPLCM